jgi:hypothetical protein
LNPSVVFVLKFIWPFSFGASELDLSHFLRKFSVPGKNALSSPPHPIKKDPPSKQINTTGELRITNYELRAGNRFWGITNYELRTGNRFWGITNYERVIGFGELRITNYERVIGFGELRITNYERVIGFG